ncbi:MAG: hypothetical protein IKQ71_10855 [Lachnospiraceae bacterium]|nr:hypothetical protein [Lachnospiraceae bacterium]
MKKGLTEIVFILDRSGSMGGLEADTIGGYNSMIAKQRKEKGEAVLSTVLFDDKVEILYDRKPIDKASDLTDNEYYVRGCTALLDAIGGAIHHISGIHKVMPEDEKPEKTLFIITTDGMENASKKYTYGKIKKMIEKKKNKHQWEFVFLGANIDAVAVAGQFGVDKHHAVTYECDEEGTKLNFEVMSKMVSMARSCGSAKQMAACFASDDMLAPIQEDYKKRHKGA